MWGIMKDVFWFLFKEKCIVIYVEKRLCEYKVILKRKIIMYWDIENCFINFISYDYKYIIIKLNDI